MCSHHLSQIIKVPTRITQFSKTCIDHVWTSRPELFANHGATVFSFSDHCLVYAVRKAVKCPRGQARNINARSYRKFDSNTFLEDLSKVHWSAVEESDNPDTAWGIFEGLFIPLCDKHAPFKNMKIPNQPPPWFDDEYLTLRKELQNIKSVAHKSSLAKDWYAFKATRNKLNNLAKKLKREYFESSIRDAGTDSGKLWKTVKTIIPSNQQNPIKSVKVDGNVTNDSDDRANEFNTFFPT